MRSRPSLTDRVDQYLSERRRMGFALSHMEQSLKRLAKYASTQRHRGPLTVELMAAWARQVKGGHPDRSTSARALKMFRPFTRWLQQFEPSTEVPDEAIFGPIPGRVAPHIFRDDEVADLVDAAAKIGPPRSLRAVVIQTFLGLIACTGLRISEALALTDADVDLKAGTLTIRRSKFGKSRLIVLHSSTVAALRKYRDQRSRTIPTKPEQSFFIATRGRRLGQPLGDRQAHRTFGQLRQQLGWVNRGGHGEPRIHDLRHSFAVRRLIRWNEQGVDVHQRMLALSTYLGHAKVSNTYWYLTGVPELMHLINKRFEHFVDLWGEEKADD